MLTHTYRSRPAGLDRLAYCDTSFILDLFAHANPSALGSASAAAKARTADAHGFYIWARLQGIQFYVSVFAIEEVYHKLLFLPINSYIRSNAGYSSWKRLRAQDPTTFNALITIGRSAIGSFQNYVRGSGLALITVGAGPFSGIWLREARLCRYARALLALYDAEAMDAFHYALMRRCGITLAVSSDRDWTAFPHGTLITAP